MKIKDVLNAITPLKKLMSLDLAAKDAYKVAKLATKIEEELSAFNKLFAAAKERCKEDADALERELAEIAELDTECDIKYITIKMPEGKLSAQDVLALTPFIAFEIEEDE